MKKLFILIISSLAIFSCSKEQTIQKYFIEKHEDVDFTALDLSTKTLFSNFEDLSQEEKDHLKNISKLNVLVLNSSNAKKISEEYNEVVGILNQPRYSSLMQISSEEGSMMMNIKGKDVNKISELVFLGKNDEMGLIVVRVLGKQINPNNFYQTAKLAEKIDSGLLENFAKQLNID